MIIIFSNTFNITVCRKRILMLSFGFLISFQELYAQLSPMGAVYYQNQYLANPALAGANGGLNINGGYRTQWNNIPGSPTMQTFTADYAVTEKAGLGLSFYNDKAGLFKRTSAMAGYAYRLPLNEGEDRLHFGISLGFMNERISNDDIHADPDDLTLRAFNERETFIDGNFGMAYIGKKLSIQAALPNMKSVFRKEENGNTVDKSIFFSSVSYKMVLSEGINGFDLEPKVVFRSIKGFDNILDAGANLSYAGNKVNLFGMYHTSKSASFGLGLNYQNIGINGIYTNGTSGMRGYSTGDFEINLNVRLLKKP